MKKKMIITILGIALMAALAGCSGKGNEKDKGTEEKEENTQKKRTEHPAGTVPGMRKKGLQRVRIKQMPGRMIRSFWRLPRHL